MNALARSCLALSDSWIRSRNIRPEDEHHFRDLVRNGGMQSSGEFDHWFPHWMGGSDGPKNIWFELHAGNFGSFTKDKVELLLWRNVCVDKTMSLSQAKKLYLKGWTKLVSQHREAGTRPRSAKQLKTTGGEGSGINRARRPLTLGPIPRSKVVNRRKHKPHITPEEFERLINFVDEPYATMISVAVFSGLRVSELVGLKWEDVHDEALSVDERYCRGDWSITKTTGSSSSVGVASSIISRIRQLKILEVEINWGGKGARKRFKLVRSDEPQDLVFQSLRKGAPMRDGNILRRHLRPAALKLGIDPKKATWR